MFRHQWFPVESSSTSHMLSQLSKTIKLALMSTNEERAILRARSAVQRFPVVEWRQRMEDFHKRSITTSRQIAADEAWREADCRVPLSQPDLDGEDWTPIYLEHPDQPDWVGSNSSQGADGLSIPSIRRVSSQSTEGTFLPTPQLLTPPLKRRESTSTDASEGEDFLPRSGSSTLVAKSRNSASPEAFSDFLSRVNRQIARDQKHVGDPFLDSQQPLRKPFDHSRLSSVESIASIMEEKGDSPLNKAMASVRPFNSLIAILNHKQFTDQDGEVSKAFIEKLKTLSAENSKGELSIERFLVKSEEAYFERMRKDKINGAASILSSKRDSMWDSMASSFHFESRPPCESVITAFDYD